MAYLNQKQAHAAAKKAHGRRRPLEKMPPSIKEAYYASKKAHGRRRPLEKIHPSIKEEYLAAKASKRVKINRKPTNREVFNLLMNNPYLSRKERDSMIQTHCGLMMPRKINF